MGCGKGRLRWLKEGKKERDDDDKRRDDEKKQGYGKGGERKVEKIRKKRKVWEED